MKSSSDDDYSAYVGIGHNQPPGDLDEIKKLAQDQLLAKKEVERLEKELKEAEEKYKDISERRLPGKMDHLGIPAVTLPDGTTVEVEEKVRGGLIVENRPKGHKWLEEQGHGAILKTEVSIAFPKKKLEEAKKLVERLREEELPANLERSVHANTLDAFIREQLELGKDIPLDIFSVMRQRIATVTKPKKETR